MFPERAYKPWTAREIKLLKNMLENGTSYPRMCDALQRSITAVYERAKMIRYSEFITNASRCEAGMTISKFSDPVRRPDK